MGDTPDLTLTLKVIIGIALSITTLAVLLRCWVRNVLLRKFAAEDSLIVISQACYGAFYIRGTARG